MHQIFSLKFMLTESVEKDLCKWDLRLFWRQQNQEQVYDKSIRKEDAGNYKYWSAHAIIIVINQSPYCKK